MSTAIMITSQWSSYANAITEPIWEKMNGHLMNNLPVDHQGIQLKIKIAIIIEVSKITQKSYTK